MALEEIVFCTLIIIGILLILLTLGGDLVLCEYFERRKLRKELKEITKSENEINPSPSRELFMKKWISFCSIHQESCNPLVSLIAYVHSCVNTQLTYGTQELLYENKEYQTIITNFEQLEKVILKNDRVKVFDCLSDLLSFVTYGTIVEKTDSRQQKAYLCDLKNEGKLLQDLKYYPDKKESFWMFIQEWAEKVDSEQVIDKEIVFINTYLSNIYGERVRDEIDIDPDVFESGINKCGSIIRSFPDYVNESSKGQVFDALSELYGELKVKGHNIVISGIPQPNSSFIT